MEVGVSGVDFWGNEYSDGGRGLWLEGSGYCIFMELWVWRGHGCGLDVDLNVNMELNGTMDVIYTESARFTTAWTAAQKKFKFKRELKSGI